MNAAVVDENNIHLKGVISDETPRIKIAIKDGAEKISGKLGIGGLATKKYTGSYSIIPSSSAQVLETKRKMMIDDLEIKAIPYYETSNETGMTVYIGGE